MWLSRACADARQDESEGCDVERSLGSFGHADERSRSDDVQPVRSPYFHSIALLPLTCLRSDFVEIMEMMDKRLNDKGKNWRHVFKVGLVIDKCVGCIS